MIQPIWERSHSVDVAVDVARAWAFMTETANWADPPAEFSLEGSFAEGSIGTTRMPGQAPVQWRIGRVESGRSYQIELALDGAMLCFEWSFEAVATGRTRVTQQITLSGSRAAAYVAQLEEGFGKNLQGGMTRIATAMERVR